MQDHSQHYLSMGDGLTHPHSKESLKRRTSEADESPFAQQRRHLADVPCLTRPLFAVGRLRRGTATVAAFFFVLTLFVRVPDGAATAGIFKTAVDFRLSIDDEAPQTPFVNAGLRLISRFLSLRLHGRKPSFKPWLSR